MLNDEDLRWLAHNAIELNRLLQHVAKQYDQVRLRFGKDLPLESLSAQIERASRSSQAIFDRITGRILAGASLAPGSSPVVESRREMAGASVAPFATRMPVGEVAVAEEAPKAPVILNANGRRELILLVDDDEEHLAGTGDILDFEDYRFIVARDGIEALRLYWRLGHEIDLVLLDYFLPGMNGDAVFDELKAINPDVRVVLSSGFCEQAQVSSMLARGLCGFLPKPYTHGKLIEQIRFILDA